MAENPYAGSAEEVYGHQEIFGECTHEQQHQQQGHYKQHQRQGHYEQHQHQGYYEQHQHQGHYEHYDPCNQGQHQRHHLEQAMHDQQHGQHGQLHGQYHGQNQGQHHQVIIGQHGQQIGQHGQHGGQHEQHQGQPPRTAQNQQGHSQESQKLQSEVQGMPSYPPPPPGQHQQQQSQYGGEQQTHQHYGVQQDATSGLQQPHHGHTAQSGQQQYQAPQTLAQSVQYPPSSLHHVQPFVPGEPYHQQPQYAQQPQLSGHQNAQQPPQESAHQAPHQPSQQQHQNAQQYGQTQMSQPQEEWSAPGVPLQQHQGGQRQHGWSAPGAPAQQQQQPPHALDYALHRGYYAPEQAFPPQLACIATSTQQHSQSPSHQNQQMQNQIRGGDQQPQQSGGNQMQPQQYNDQTQPQQQNGGQQQGGASGTPQNGYQTAPPNTTQQWTMQYQQPKLEPPPGIGGPHPPNPLPAISTSHQSDHEAARRRLEEEQTKLAEERKLLQEERRKLKQAEEEHLRSAAEYERKIEESKYGSTSSRTSTTGKGKDKGADNAYGKKSEDSYRGSYRDRDTPRNGEKGEGKAGKDAKDSYGREGKSGFKGRDGHQKGDRERDGLSKVRETADRSELPKGRESALKGARESTDVYGDRKGSDRTAGNWRDERKGKGERADHKGDDKFESRYSSDNDRDGNGLDGKTPKVGKFSKGAKDSYTSGKDSYGKPSTKGEKGDRRSKGFRIFENSKGEEKVSFGGNGQDLLKEHMKIEHVVETEKERAERLEKAEKAKLERTEKQQALEIQQAIERENRQMLIEDRTEQERILYLKCVIRTRFLASIQGNLLKIGIRESSSKAVEDSKVDSHCAGKPRNEAAEDSDDPRDDGDHLKKLTGKKTDYSDMVFPNDNDTALPKDNTLAGDQTPLTDGSLLPNETPLMLQENHHLQSILSEDIFGCAELPAFDQMIFEATLKKIMDESLLDLKRKIADKELPFDKKDVNAPVKGEAAGKKSFLAVKEKYVAKQEEQEKNDGAAENDVTKEKDQDVDNAKGDFTDEDSNEISEEEAAVTDAWEARGCNKGHAYSSAANLKEAEIDLAKETDAIKIDAIVARDGEAHDSSIFDSTVQGAMVKVMDDIATFDFEGALVKADGIDANVAIAPEDSLFEGDQEFIKTATLDIPALQKWGKPGPDTIRHLPKELILICLAQKLLSKKVNCEPNREIIETNMVKFMRDNMRGEFVSELTSIDTPNHPVLPSNTLNIPGVVMLPCNLELTWKSRGHGQKGDGSKYRKVGSCLVKPDGGVRNKIIMNKGAYQDAGSDSDSVSPAARVRHRGMDSSVENCLVESGDNSDQRKVDNLKIASPTHTSSLFSSISVVIANVVTGETTRISERDEKPCSHDSDYQNAMCKAESKPIPSKTTTLAFKSEETTEGNILVCNADATKLDDAKASKENLRLDNALDSTKDSMIDSQQPKSSDNIDDGHHSDSSVEEGLNWMPGKYGRGQSYRENFSADISVEINPLLDSMRTKFYKEWKQLMSSLNLSAHGFHPNWSHLAAKPKNCKRIISNKEVDLFVKQNLHTFYSFLRDQMLDGAPSAAQIANGITSSSSSGKKGAYNSFGVGSKGIAGVVYGASGYGGSGYGGSAHGSGSSGSSSYGGIGSHSVRFGGSSGKAKGGTTSSGSYNKGKRTSSYRNGGNGGRSGKFQNIPHHTDKHQHQSGNNDKNGYFNRFRYYAESDVTATEISALSDVSKTSTFSSEGSSRARKLVPSEGSRVRNLANGKTVEIGIKLKQVNLMKKTLANESWVLFGNQNPNHWIHPETIEIFKTPKAPEEVDVQKESETKDVRSWADIVKTSSEDSITIENENSITIEKNEKKSNSKESMPKESTISGIYLPPKESTPKESTISDNYDLTYIVQNLPNNLEVEKMNKVIYVSRSQFRQCETIIENKRFPDTSVDLDMGISSFYNSPLFHESPLQPRGFHDSFCWYCIDRLYAARLGCHEPQVANFESFVRNLPICEEFGISSDYKAVPATRTLGELIPLKVRADYNDEKKDIVHEFMTKFNDNGISLLTDLKEGSLSQQYAIVTLEKEGFQGAVTQLSFFQTNDEWHCVMWQV